VNECPIPDNLASFRYESSVVDRGRCSERPLCKGQINEIAEFTDGLRAEDFEALLDSLIDNDCENGNSFPESLLILKSDASKSHHLLRCA